MAQKIRFMRSLYGHCWLVQIDDGEFFNISHMSKNEWTLTPWSSAPSVSGTVSGTNDIITEPFAYFDKEIKRLETEIKCESRTKDELSKIIKNAIIASQINDN
jgi:hypothetical protein